MNGSPELQPSPSPRRPWLLYFFVAWAFILAFNTGVILWDITGLLGQFISPSTAFGWLSLVIAFVAPFGFGLSVYGLWGLRPWGRYLFMALSIVFFGTNLVGVWLPSELPLTVTAQAQLRNARLLSTARYGLAIIIPLIYFNLGHIKASFRESTNRQISK